MSNLENDASPRPAHLKHHRTTLRLTQPGSYTVTLNLEQLTACLVSLHAMQTMIDGLPHERQAAIDFHLAAQQFLGIPATRLYGDDIRDSDYLYGPLSDMLWEQLSVDEWEAL